MIVGKNLFFTCPFFPVDKLTDPTGVGEAFTVEFMGYIAKA